ncbi:hypothetical protein JHK87_014011 [Glycine soja]|nr:hypothetical protein JHK87_014011 [Glycine soja]
MGEVSESTTTKRKKKGRPSLLDLQKRSLKKEQQNHHQQRQSNNSNSANSHNNKNKTNKNAVPHDDDEDERKEKKHKLLVGLNSHLQNPTLFPNSQPFNSDPNKRRKTIDPLQTDWKVPKATDSKHGSQGESGPTTPLPDKKLLLFILDRLQNYMKLGRLDTKIFGTCAVARAMQEIARKDFENLRQDSDDDSEPQPKIVQKGRPPGKHSRKSLGLGMPPSERVGPESSSDATLASGADIGSGSNGYNLRKVPSKFQPTDSSARAYNSTFNSGGYTGCSDWENEFPASVVKAVLRYGKKQFAVDETRRDTYKNPVTLGNERPMLSTVEDEFKQLLARQHFPVRDEGRTSDHPVPEDYRSRFSSPSGSFPLANRSGLQSGDMAINNYQNDLNPVINIPGGSESITPMRIQQESMVHSDDFGSHDRLGSNFPSQMKMVRLADLTGSSSAGVAPQMFDMDPPISNHIAHTNVCPSLKGQYLSKSSQLDSGNLLAREPGFEQRSWSQGLAGKSSWQGSEVPTKQNSFALANDINGEIGTTNSSNSNVEAGSQLQPNLALQL